MLMKKVALAALIATLSISGAALADNKADAEAAINAAIAAQKAAAKVKGEWRDTGKLIKKAQEAAAEGNYGTAVKLANKAKAQGELGKDQAMSQAGIGNPKYLYN